MARPKATVSGGQSWGNSKVSDDDSDPVDIFFRGFFLSCFDQSLKAVHARQGFPSLPRTTPDFFLFGFSELSWFVFLTEEEPLVMLIPFSVLSISSSWSGSNSVIFKKNSRQNFESHSPTPDL